MIDLIKSIIKWIIIILIIVLGIVFLSRGMNHNNSKNNNLSSQVKEINKSEISQENTEETFTTIDNNASEYSEEVNLPDTGTSERTEMIVGLLILSGSIIYIHKKERNN